MRFLLASRYTHQSEEDQELDGILSDLQKVQAPLGGMGSYDRMYGNDPDSQAVMNRVNSAYQLSRSGRITYPPATAEISRRHKTRSGIFEFPLGWRCTLIPRSEILARSSNSPAR